MAQVNLLNLLAERPIVHPTKLEEFIWNADGLSVLLSGYRWWGGPSKPDPLYGQIRFDFSGITSGNISPTYFDFDDDEALEDFSVEATANVPWAQRSDFSVFCSEWIPEPLRLYAKVDDFLAVAGSFLTPGDFLNQAATVSSFLRLAASDNFFVGSGPEAIRELICEELVAQDVRHNVVGRRSDDTGALLVKAAGSAFICQSAVADFD